MDKKSDTHAYLASPAIAAGNVAILRPMHVSGAILRTVARTEPEPSPVAAESLPASLWPRVDEYLDEPDESHRWERIGDERMEASPATLDHGDPHFELDALVKAHLAKSYAGSTDLKTRVSKKHEYASDTCVRKAGIDPKTGSRYLEQLVFEVVNKRSAKETKARAKGFAARGVRRQIGIFVRDQTVREWLKRHDDWGEPLDPDGSLQDSCLAVPLPLAALFDPVLAQEAITRAAEAKDDPVILEIKDKSEKRGEKRGEKRSRVAALLTVLSTRGFALSEEVLVRIRAADSKTLERWLRRAVTASSLEEVTGEG
jgi:hypothetical protein